MKVSGPLFDVKIKENMLTAVVSEEYRDAFRNFISKRLTHEATAEKPRTMVGSVSFGCEIGGTGEGGILHLALFSPSLSLETKYATHTRPGQNTFYGIARFITWAQIGSKPDNEDMYWVVEALIDKYAPVELHPIHKKEEPLRPGDPRLDTVGMSKLIQGALNELSLQDIPDYVMDVIGDDMRNLWRRWYEWRYSMGEEDPLFHDLNLMEWEEYKKWNPVCEFTGVSGVPGNPLERMHIVSGGSSIADYEQPWNWIHALHSVHRRQHEKGWSSILKEYPHMKDKVERARKLAQKRGLEVIDEWKSV